MSTPNEREKDVRLTVVMKAEDNARLEEIARESRCTKNEVFRKAFTLFDVAFEAKKNKQRIGILDKDKNLLTEIIGI